MGGLESLRVEKMKDGEESISSERKIVSWNVNGLRAVYKKGLLNWVEKVKPDIFCLQEIKAQREDLPSRVAEVEGYYSFFNSGKKRGHSGVAVYTREKPIEVSMNIGFERFDEEGRFVLLRFGDFSLINVYLPHGGRKKENLDYKISVYSRLLDFLSTVKGDNLVLVGDFNIAHEDIDLARPQQNKDNIMFTPEERKQIDEIIGVGFVDSFRSFNPKGGNYTWFSYRRDAKERGLGWRIDYAFVSKFFANRLRDAFILREVSLGSDHCPIGVLIG